jgi:hypothetical protein
VEAPNLAPPPFEEPILSMELLGKKIFSRNKYPRKTPKYFPSFQGWYPGKTLDSSLVD